MRSPSIFSAALYCAALTGAAVACRGGVFVGINQSRYLTEAATLSDPATLPTVSDPTTVIPTPAVAFAGVSATTHYANSIGLAPSNVSVSLDSAVTSTDLAGIPSLAAHGESHVGASSTVTGQTSDSASKSFFFYMFQVSEPSLYQFSGFVASSTTAGSPTLNNQAKLYELGGPTLYQTSGLNETISQVGYFDSHATYILTGWTDLSAATAGIDHQEGDASYYVALSLLSVPEPTTMHAVLGVALVGFAVYRRACISS